MPSFEIYNPTDSELLQAVHDVSVDYEVAPVNQVGDTFVQPVDVRRLASRLEELREQGLVSKAFTFPGLDRVTGIQDGSWSRTGFVPTEAGLESLKAPE